jgi:N-ethylmaleimide reductase
MSVSHLFEPVQLGALALPNRFVMAPMTRNRADGEAVQAPYAGEYYAQRADAGLIITEATAVDLSGRGYPRIPGIWNDAQTEAWRNVVEQVHAAGGRIALQIFHTSRISHSSLVGGTPVAPSAIAPEGDVFTASFQSVPYETPVAIAEADVPNYVAMFGRAAANARAAGFDGLEIHAANGYLIDLFLRSVTNRRTDAYGQDRTRFLREVVAAALAHWPADRVGVRLSPFNAFNSMNADEPAETFLAAAQALRPVGLAYLHVTTMRIEDRLAGEDFARALAAEAGAPLVVNYAYDRADAEAAVDRGVAAVAFGVPYLANPDLPERYRIGAELNAPIFETFYQGDEKGYLDYPRLPMAVA